MEDIKEILKDFLADVEFDMESYFNTEDPSDYYSGNTDDDIQHGYSVGYNDAKVELYKKVFGSLGLPEVFS